MAINSFPWFCAVDHLPAGGAGASRSLMVGDGSLDASGPESGIVDSGALGRHGVRGHPRTNGWFQVNTPAVDELTVGVRIGVDTTPSNFSTLLAVRNSSNDLICSVRNNTTLGVLEVMREGTVLATGDTPIASGGVYYLEFYVLIDGTDGAFELRINGVSEVDDSGVNTAANAGPCTRLVFRGPGSTGSTTGGALTDFYVRSDGPQFYGPIVLRPLRPTEDVQAEWTPDSGADNYARVNETTTDQDTSYIESDELGDRDVYELESLSAGANSIIAVVGVTVAQSPNGGAPLVATGISDGVNVVVGEGRNIGPQNDYQTQATVFPTRPDGGAWSPASVDALSLAVEAA